MKKPVSTRRTSITESKQSLPVSKKPKKGGKGNGTKVKKGVSEPIEGAEQAVVAEPQLWFESTAPSDGKVVLTNSGPSPLEVSLWAQSGIGIPEPTLLAKFRVQAGHSVNYSASNVVRFEILTEQPNNRQTFNYSIEFKQKGGRGAPEGLSLRTNRKARCYVVIEAKYTEDTQTHLTVDNVSGKGFKTIIDAGVYANCQPYGVSVELKNSGKSDNLPRREVTFHSA